MLDDNAHRMNNSNARRMFFQLCLIASAIAVALSVSQTPVAAADAPALPTFYPNGDHYNEYDKEADVVLLYEAADKITVWHPAISKPDYTSEADVCRFLKTAEVKKGILLVVFTPPALPVGGNANERVTQFWRQLRKSGFDRVVLYASEPSRHWE